MSYVLQLCGWYPSRVDPFSGDFVQRHARSIATQVKTVALFAAKDPATSQAEPCLEIQQQGNLYEYRYYYPKKGWFDKLWSQWFYLQGLRLAMDDIEEKHGIPLLLHVNIVWRAAIWALRLRKKWNVPIIITENSTEYQTNAQVYIERGSAARQAIFKRIYNACQLFIPVSYQLGKRIQELYGSIPFTVVPNAVDTSLFYPITTVSKPTFRLVHVSTMNYQKNFEGIKRTIEKLIAHNPGVEVIMVGPKEQSTLDWWQADPARRKAITFTGWIPYEEVAAVIRSSDLLFLFSRYENLPCVILEALCCGVPVVSTNVGGIGEVIHTKNGILIEEGDEEALLEALRMAIAGEVIFDKTSIASQASALYNFESIGKAFAAAYQSIGIQLPSLTPKPTTAT